ncbi:MAG: hypothetical protein U0470_10700 [Anaerolineae bacterium]
MLMEDVFIVDELPADMTFVPGSGIVTGTGLPMEPTVSPDGRTLTWRLVAVPLPPPILGLAYRAPPDRGGRAPDERRGPRRRHGRLRGAPRPGVPDPAGDRPRAGDADADARAHRDPAAGRDVRLPRDPQQGAAVRHRRGAGEPGQGVRLAEPAEPERARAGRAAEPAADAWTCWNRGTACSTRAVQQRDLAGRLPDRPP